MRQVRVGSQAPRPAHSGTGWGAGLQRGTKRDCGANGGTHYRCGRRARQPSTQRKRPRTVSWTPAAVCQLSHLRGCSGWVHLGFVGLVVAGFFLKLTCLLCLRQRKRSHGTLVWRGLGLSGRAGGGKGFAQTAHEKENKADFFSPLFFFLPFKEKKKLFLLAVHQPAEKIKPISRNNINPFIYVT